MFRVAIIGTGNIGTDLLVKLSRLKDVVEVVAFVGRRPLTKILPVGDVPYYDTSIDYFRDNPHCCDLVFDCTDAVSARSNAPVFQAQNIKVFDLTPSQVGQYCAPNVNSAFLSRFNNINMVTCGGQVAIPLLAYLSEKFVVSYAEVVSQISSESAGMATRINIDKYIETTEQAISSLVGITNCKVILNINPCDTEMQTTIFLKATYFHNEPDFSDFPAFVEKMKSYVPHYEVACPPQIDRRREIVIVSVRILGAGDYLSRFAGNLDVINCAAIELTKRIVTLRVRGDARQSANSYNNVLDI